MQRLATIAGLGFLAVIVAFIVLNLVRNPVEAKFAALDADGVVLSSGAESIHTIPETEYADLQRAITAKPNLWQPLIEAPPPKKNAPDFNRILAGVVVTRDKMGSGDGMKVRVKVPGGKHSGDWFGKGDTLKGTKVKDITESAVVVSLVQEGQEYTHALPRGQ